MIEVYPRLWVGDDDDATRILERVGADARGPYSWEVARGEETSIWAMVSTAKEPYHWAMVSAAKEPYHRALVGYEGRGAPKDSPEYYSARRGRHLALNWVDVDDPKWFRMVELREALTHIEAAQRMELDCLVHCNQGVSRSPAVALAWLATYGPDEWGALSFERAEEKFRAVYPPYDPTSGVRDFIREALW